MSDLFEPERAAFEARIGAELGDWTNHLVYADWLETVAGDPALGHCYRWMARNQKHPHRRTHYHNDVLSVVRTEPVRTEILVPKRKVPDRCRWAWYAGYWTSLARKVGGYDEKSVLNRRPIWMCLRGTNPDTQVYPTLRAAIADLAYALDYLRRLVSLTDLPGGP